MKIATSRPETKVTHSTVQPLSARITLFTLLLLLVSAEVIFSQTIPVGDLREEQLRIQQLIHGSSHSAMVSRPVWMGTYETYLQRAEPNRYWWNRHLGNQELNLDLEGIIDSSYPLQFGLYEPVFTTTTNSTHPSGYNNAASWYGKGINTEVQGGFYITSEFLTVNFRPHISWQQNRDFVTPRFIPRDGDNNPFYVAEGIGDIIDRPFRFGPDPFWTTDIGHSSIRAHYNEFEIGYSSEPLWWGGNVQFPLVMSNNAPGVRHLFLGTRSPYTLPWIGNVEFKWLIGWPEDSGYFNQPEPYQRDRFLNAAVLSYSPAFLPDLHLGLTRTFHSYVRNSGFMWRDLFVMFDPIHLKNVVERHGSERTPRNEINSYFARWVWPEGRTEIYGEFYREDFSWDGRDFMMEPRHNAGYAFGFQSLLEAPLARWYRVNLEFTNTVPSGIREVRPQFYYYTHEEIRQGHTNRGHLLGAAIGPGSNSQYLSVDALTVNGRVGMFVQRLADNNHFHYEYDRSIVQDVRYSNFFLHRTNMTVGGRFLALWHPLQISGLIAWTRPYIYGRFDYGGDGPVNRVKITDFIPQDLENVQLQITIRYLFPG